jgi:hypothetical protein
MIMTEEMRKQIFRHKTKVWITAIFITIALVMITAYAMRWIIGLFNVNITLWQAVVITIIINLIIGFIKGLSYAKKKVKTK